MPVFGKSLFETVLDALAEPPDEEEPDAPAPVRGFHASFVGREWSANPDIESEPLSIFEEFLPDSLPADPIPLATPAWIGRTGDAEIAEDLALSTCRNEHDLRERRRLFALENHPDRVPPEFRDQATRRMMIANQMVDAALGKPH